MSNALLPHEIAFWNSMGTHAPDECISEACAVHNPSNHRMRTWPLHWRSDRRILERFCTHGVGHDDPDDRTCREAMGQEASGIHGCCGCCVKNPLVQDVLPYD